MIFVLLLIATTISIAGSAAFFSVYGLAYTFSGTFWSVVIMGASLEAGKLMTASYLYRYWTHTHMMLRWYLIAGVLALMVLTSTGIFSYLSAGYQADVLPLKQLNEQVRLLDEERERAITRKKQIDDQLVKGPSVGNVTSGDKIDPNAAKTIREARRTQESTGKQYKNEQQALQIRVAELDKQLLELKQELVKTEAHIGPITYVAKAFDLEVDNATKYLIFLIIFAFDPMAVALTLAVNIVLRQLNEDKLAHQQQKVDKIEHQYFPPPEQIVEHVEPIVEHVEHVKPIVEHVEHVEPIVAPAPVEEPVVEVVPVPPPIPAPTPSRPTTRRTRPYNEHWDPNEEGVEHRIEQLIGHYKYLQEKQQSGEPLSQDDVWEFNAIRNILQKHGYLQYLN